MNWKGTKWVAPLHRAPTGSLTIVLEMILDADFGGSSRRRDRLNEVIVGCPNALNLVGAVYGAVYAK